MLVAIYQYNRTLEERCNINILISPVLPFQLSYLIVDLVVWWGIRGYINEFRKKKLKLPPIAYFSTYRGSISHLPTGYMWSPQLVPKPPGTFFISSVSFFFLKLSIPGKDFSCNSGKTGDSGQL
jgi:hypothetical protein